MDGLPFDDSSWIIPHRNGRIYDESVLQFYPGEYVAGWIKRGPSGSLPHIRSGAEETVSAMLEGLHLGQVRYHSVKIYSGRVMVVSAEKIFTVYEDWLLMDSVEKNRSKEHCRPRVKQATLNEKLNILVDS